MVVGALVVGDLLAGAAVWVVGALAIYWNLEGKGVLPSNDHVRVLAVTWPVTFIVFLGWSLFKSTLYVNKVLVIDTAASLKRVAQWQGHLLPPPRILDQAALDAEAEVNRIAPEA